MAIYNGKHCVFEMVGLESIELMRNSDTNLDNDSAYNDWNISNMRNTHLPARLLLLSSELQTNLTNTTIQTATNGNNGTLVSTSDKLFLAAEKEITKTRNYSRTEEFSALTTWNYWVNHTSTSDRIKKDQNNTAKNYRLRSPHLNDTIYVVIVKYTGGFNGVSAVNTYCVSPCFAF